MTTGPSEFRIGDAVTILTGAAANQPGRILRVLPTQGTVLGKEQVFMYKTDAGPEFYRSQDLRKR